MGILSIGRGSLAEGAPLNYDSRSYCSQFPIFSVLLFFLKILGRITVLCSLSLFAAGPVCTGKGRVTSINSRLK